jgi:hypothetical protein
VDSGEQVKATEHDAEAAEEDPVDALDFAW